jgi:hypothetical protein
MFLTSRMNFMIIGHDLEVLWKKPFGLFWSFLGSSTFRPQNFRQEVSAKAEKSATILFLYGKPEIGIYLFIHDFFVFLVSSFKLE